MKIKIKKENITFIIVIILIIFNYFAFEKSVNKYIHPIEIPYANTTIKQGQQITKDMISYKKMPKVLLDESIYTKIDDIIGNYVKFYTEIPKGSVIYKESISSLEDRPDKAILKLNEGQIVFPISVDVLKTSGKSIVPNQYVDIYGHINISKEKTLYNKLFKNIRVLAVKDRLGNDVFDKDYEKRTPSVILIAVNQNLVNYLKLLQTYGTIELVATYESYSEDFEECTLYDDSTLIDWLNEHYEY